MAPDLAIGVGRRANVGRRETERDLGRTTLNECQLVQWWKLECGGSDENSGRSLCAVHSGGRLWPGRWRHSLHASGYVATHLYCFIHHLSTFDNRGRHDHLHDLYDVYDCADADRS